MPRGTNRLDGRAARGPLDIPHLSLELVELTRLAGRLLLLGKLLLLWPHQALHRTERAARFRVAALEG